MDDQDPKIVDEKVDFAMPESGPGQDAAGFSAKAQQEEFLGDASQEKPQVEPEQPQSQPKESEWPMGARKSIEVNGRRWAYWEYGNPDGIDVLSVHGWLGSSAEGNARLARALAGEVLESKGLQNLSKPRMESLDKIQPHGGAPKGAEKVRQLTESLKGKYNVIVPELPGFGKTPEMDNPTVDRMADELADFYRALGKKPAVVFGSSAGAILATKMALHHPDLVSVLALQSLMIKPTDMALLPLVGGWLATRRPISGILKTFPNFAKKQVFLRLVTGDKEFKSADEEAQKFIVDSAKEGHVPTMLGTLRDIGKNIEDEVAQVQAPVVVLDGVNGGLVSIEKSKKNVGRFHPEAGDNLHEKIAERQVVYFQVGGAAGEHSHGVINSAPEIVATLINHAVDFFGKEGQAGGRGPKKPERPVATPPEQSRLDRVRERLARFTHMGR